MTTFWAEFALPTGLDAVKVAEPFVVVAKLNPVAELSATVPCEAEGKSESGSVSAAESVEANELPVLSVRASDPPPVDEVEPVPLIAGVLKAVTVSATLVEAASVSPGFVTEAEIASEPE